MIIDFHTHFFPDALAARALRALTESLDGEIRPVTDATEAGHLQYMARCGIDISVVMPVVTKASQFESTNAWAKSFESEKLIPFAGFWPHTDDYRRDIDRICEMGFKGVKLHPEYQNFIVDAPEMLPIYDYALGKGLILLFHAGADPSFKPPYKTSPRQFANVLDAMRGGVIVAAHLGGHDEWEESARHLHGREIYLDTSMGLQFYPREHFLRTVREHGAHRLLFATDAPWSDGAEEIRLMKALPISEAEREMIFSGNARRLLGLPEGPSGDERA